jgi:hypothetical protein
MTLHVTVKSDCGLVNSKHKTRIKQKIQMTEIVQLLYKMTGAA